MKISFIIPAYNEEKTISRTLNSILNQKNLPDFEIIVIDNGSTDKTKKIAQKHPKTKAITYTAKKGPAAARNEGARNAKGEILIFFDADMLVPEEWAKKMLDTFKEKPKLVALSGPYRYLEFNFWQRLGEKIFYLILLRPLNFILRKLKIGAVAIGGNMAVKKWAFEKVGGFDPDIKFYGDEANLIRRLIKLGDINFFPMLWSISSARRFLKEGFLKTQWLYTKNFFSELLFHKVATKKHTDVR
jgi:glycosyltransferase involved in cell wall biosynthesis